MQFGAKARKGRVDFLEVIAGKQGKTVCNHEAKEETKFARIKNTTKEHSQDETNYEWLISKRASADYEITREWWGWYGRVQ